MKQSTVCTQAANEAAADTSCCHHTHTQMRTVQETPPPSPSPPHPMTTTHQLQGRDNCVPVWVFSYFPHFSVTVFCKLVCWPWWRGQCPAWRHPRAGGGEVTWRDMVTGVTSLLMAPDPILLTRASSEPSRRLREVLSSRRRLLLGPSPGWKRLLALSHLRH